MISKLAMDMDFLSQILIHRTLAIDMDFQSQIMIHRTLRFWGRTLAMDMDFDGQILIHRTLSFSDSFRTCVRVSCQHQY